MTQRLPDGGYKYPNAYRTWLPEQDTILLAVSLKHRSRTGLQSVVSVEELSVALGRSVDSILKRAAHLQVNILTRVQIYEIEDELNRLSTNTESSVDEDTRADMLSKV